MYPHAVGSFKTSTSKAGARRFTESPTHFSSQLKSKKLMPPANKANNYGQIQTNALLPTTSLCGRNKEQEETVTKCQGPKRSSQVHNECQLNQGAKGRTNANLRQCYPYKIKNNQGIKVASPCQKSKAHNQGLQNEQLKLFDSPVQEESHVKEVNLQKITQNLKQYTQSQSNQGFGETVLAKSKSDLNKQRINTTKRGRNQPSQYPYNTATSSNINTGSERQFANDNSQNKNEDVMIVKLTERKSSFYGNDEDIYEMERLNGAQLFNSANQVRLLQSKNDEAGSMSLNSASFKQADQSPNIRFGSSSLKQMIKQKSMKDLKLPLSTLHGGQPHHCQNNPSGGSLLFGGIKKIDHQQESRLSAAEECDYVRYGAGQSRSRSLSNLENINVEAGQVSSIPDEFRSTANENYKLNLQDNEEQFDSPSERTLLDVLGLCSTQRGVNQEVGQRESLSENDYSNSPMILVHSTNQLLRGISEGPSPNQILSHNYAGSENSFSTNKFVFNFVEENRRQLDALQEVEIESDTTVQMNYCQRSRSSSQLSGTKGEDLPLNTLQPTTCNNNFPKRKSVNEVKGQQQMFRRKKPLLSIKELLVNSKVQSPKNAAWQQDPKEKQDCTPLQKAVSSDNLNQIMKTKLIKQSIKREENITRRCSTPWVSDVLRLDSDPRSTHFLRRNEDKCPHRFQPSFLSKQNRKQQPQPACSNPNLGSKNTKAFEQQPPIPKTITKASLSSQKSKKMSQVIYERSRNMINRLISPSTFGLRTTKNQATNKSRNLFGTTIEKPIVRQTQQRLTLEPQVPTQAEKGPEDLTQLSVERKPFASAKAGQIKTFDFRPSKTPL